MEAGLKRGEDFFSAGKLKEARGCFEAVLQTDPQNKEAYNNLGVLAYREGKMGEAFDLISKALKIDPFYREALLNFSHVLRRLGRMAQILPLLERVARRYPDDRVWLDLLNEARSAKGEAEEEGADRGGVRAGRMEGRAAPFEWRVLHGTMEIANQMNTYVSGLRNLRVSAKTVCYYPNYLGYRSDYVIDVPSFKDVHEANRKTRELAS
ncbi:MAG: tetratricopeptide repeat protein [Deltaproteobacteria bacterium]|nr:MAG: tetratricopeptide repeat protein [Deltaproteobacteria bacterium]